MPPREKRQRIDASENRIAILTAAKSALEESANVSLNAIAKRAGVANATLYRHFPTRESLVLEVYLHEVRQVAEAGDALLLRRPPADALREWVERLAQYAMTKHGLAEALLSASGSDSPHFDDTYVLIVGALARLLAAAEAAGDVRSGLDASDVILALAGLWQIDPATDWQTRARRLYEIVFDGLRPSSHSDLPRGS